MKTAFKDEARKILINAEDAMDIKAPPKRYYCLDPHCNAEMFLRRGDPPCFATKPSSGHAINCIAYDGVGAKPIPEQFFRSNTVWSSLQLLCEDYTCLPSSGKRTLNSLDPDLTGPRVRLTLKQIYQICSACGPNVRLGGTLARGLLLSEASYDRCFYNYIGWGRIVEAVLDQDSVAIKAHRAILLYAPIARKKYGICIRLSEDDYYDTRNKREKCYQKLLSYIEKGQRVAVIVVARWEWVKNPAASLGLEDIDVPVYYGRIVAPRKQIYIPKHKLTSNTDQTDMR